LSFDVNKIEQMHFIKLQNIVDPISYQYYSLTP